IIKNFKSTNTFIPFQSEMVKASTFLDIQCSNQKSQDFNKTRQNSEDLLDSGHFIEDEEFSLLVIYILEQIQGLCSIKEKTKDQKFKLQLYCFTFIGLLDGGLRREVTTVSEQIH